MHFWPSESTHSHDIDVCCWSVRSVEILRCYSDVVRRVSVTRGWSWLVDISKGMPSVFAWWASLLPVIALRVSALRIALTYKKNAQRAFTVNFFLTQTSCDVVVNNAEVGDAARRVTRGWPLSVDIFPSETPSAVTRWMSLSLIALRTWADCAIAFALCGKP